jgi:hypothetical protein
LSAADHLATYQWLFPQNEVSNDKEDHYRFMLGRFQERSGDRAAALESYRMVYDSLKQDGSLRAGGRLPEATAAAVKRLSK